LVAGFQRAPGAGIAQRNYRGEDDLLILASVLAVDLAQSRAEKEREDN
jgi:hypothetical protein